MTITDQSNQIAPLYESINQSVFLRSRATESHRRYAAFVQNPGSAFYIHANLVTVISECRVKRVLCKTWTGTLANSAESHQTPQNAASDQSLQCLLKLQAVPVEDQFNSLVGYTRTIDTTVLSVLWFSATLPEILQVELRGLTTTDIIEVQWLEHIWDPGNLF